jgi:hypothetical protein
MHMAEQTVWAAIVSVLATFRIAKAKNEFREEIDVKPEFTNGLDKVWCFMARLAGTNALP